MLADGLSLRYRLPKPKGASGYLTSQRKQSEPGTWILRNTKMLALSGAKRCHLPLKENVALKVPIFLFIQQDHSWLI